MRVAALVSFVVVLGGAGSETRAPDHPGCGVYSFSSSQVADKRHGRLILGATVSSADEALKIAHGVALGMAEIVDLDVVEVYVNRPEDAIGLAVPGEGDPGETAIALVRHVTAGPEGTGGAWKALVRTPEPAAGPKAGPHTVLDAAQIEARIARNPLSESARKTVCGIR